MTPQRPLRRVAPLRPESSQERTSDSRDRQSIGVPLAKLIKRKLVGRPGIIMHGRQRSLAAERFRRLKTLLVNRYPEESQVIVVTSAAPREGKSTVAANLALAFAADRHEKTLLLDADLRRPTVGRLVEPAPQLGLTHLLTEQAGLEHVVLGLERSPLEILPVGEPADDPVKLLSSSRARKLFGELRERYARVIVDTPPIIAFTDADAVGALADGALLVARANMTLAASYKQAISAVTSMRVLGVVLNDAAFSVADWNRYDSYRHDYDRYYKERTQ